MFCYQKQIFIAPHRRLEDLESQQQNMERAFEDMYLAATGLNVVFLLDVQTLGDCDWLYCENNSKLDNVCI